MISSHAGSDKWEQLQKDQTSFMSNTKWNDCNYTLEKFTGMHRSLYVQLEEAEQHVNFQLPIEHTRVGYLIDNIQNNDPDLRAAIANIGLNNNGMQDNFEDAVACLLPVDPYVKHKKSNSNRGQIFDTNALKHKSESKTGVEMRWYKPHEYTKLSKEQQSELYEWQSANKETTKKLKIATGFTPSKQSAKKKLRSQVADLKAQLKIAEQDPSIAELTAILAPCTGTQCSGHETNSHSTAVENPAVAAAVKLRGILKRK